MKKLVKIVTVVLIFIAIGTAILYKQHNEPLPNGPMGNKADALAMKMLQALNYDAFKKTRYLEWNFRGKHFYQWDKLKDTVEIRWDNYKVVLHTKNTSNSVVYQNNQPMNAPKVLAKAIAYFNNDSFWLVAPYKVFDKGIERRWIEQEDGSAALLVTYTSGGSTPGDSYLWKLDSTGRPISYQMWVSIIPIGGMEASWDDWVTTSTGAMLPKSHQLPIGKLELGDVKAYNKK